MTAIYYPDCDATSPSGRFTLEARSPDNGTIPRRDGRTGDSRGIGVLYNSHQRGFRYRLLDRATIGEARVVWERWQTQHEDSPHELAVSDGGWSVVRTHGSGPEVVVLSPAGRETLRVRIAAADPSNDWISQPAPPPVAGDNITRRTWRARHLADTSAGMFWTLHAWRYFLRHDGADLFVWRTHWGQRLALDLAHGDLVPDDLQAADQPPGRAMLDRKGREAHGVLARLSARMDDVRRALAADWPASVLAESEPLWEDLARVVSAAHLAGETDCRRCVPLLRAWEPIRKRKSTTTSFAFEPGDGRSLEPERYRPAVHHALRRLGGVPAGYPTYHFLDTGRRRLLADEPLPDRRARMAGLDASMKAGEVLRLLGSPDHIRDELRNDEVGLHRVEEWEYDSLVGGRWVTRRIVWDRRRVGDAMAGTDEAPSYWLADERRAVEIMDF